MLNDNPEIANSDGYIYYLKIGSLYKIGITRTNIGNRIAKLKSTSGLEVKLLSYKKMKVIDAFRLEQDILEKYRDNRVYRVWSTELFDYDILNGIV